MSKGMKLGSQKKALKYCGLKCILHMIHVDYINRLSLEGQEKEN